MIEVIAAITLTAIVLGIAAGALSAATTARAAVLTHQTTGEAESRVRTMLTDMLQHGPQADAASEPLMRVERGATGAALVFLSTGVVEPFGTGAVWRVRVADSDSGLALMARSLDPNHAEQSVHAILPSVPRFDVRFMERARDGEQTPWRSDWPLAQARPRVIEVHFADRAFLVTLDPLEDAR